MIDQTMIKKLKDAGVGADIIINLLLEEEPANPAPAAAPEQKEQPAEAPETPAAPAEKQPDPDPILKAIADLTGAIQASNILRTGREKAEQPTADDVLAEILSGKKGV